MRPQSTTVETKIARIAGRAHGVITHGELLRCGLSAAGIKRRIKKGLLIPEYRGVYRVGHRAPSVEASYMAAVKAAGEGAVLSGRAAAFLHGLIKGPPPPPEVTVPSKRNVDGITIHRSKRIERTMVRGIPVTTVARTLVDTAADLDEAELARAFHEAGVRYRTTPNHVKAILEHRPTTKGAAKLKAVMDGDVPISLSQLERIFIALLRQKNLPLPQTNKDADGKRVDARWPEHRVTVELLSYRYHNSRYAWEQDHERRRQARARGDVFRTYTWRDVVEDPTQMLEELRELLAPERPAPRRTDANGR